MYRISCFADEIASDFQTQLSVMGECGIRYLELRSAWDTGVLDLSGAQLAQIETMLDGHGVSVSCIGSAVGKTGIDGPFGEVKDSLRKAIDIALRLGVGYVRTFSFFPEGKRFDEYRDRIVERLAELAGIAADREIVLLNENEKDVFTDTSLRCLNVVEAVNSPHLRCAFDTSNFRSVGEKPFDQSLKLLKPYVEYVHVKDSRNLDGVKVPAGEGDAQVKDVLDALREKDGLFLSLEPHMVRAGLFRGFSGPEKFKVAHRALTGILDQLQINYT